MFADIGKPRAIVFQLTAATVVALVYAAPSIEACPNDSILSNDECVCNADACQKPPCLGELVVARNGSLSPGSCCPVYSCEGCKNDTLINGKCPCVPNAVLNDKGECECIDKEQHIVEGQCLCNPRQCELPQICDRKSVLVTLEEGCCRKTTCIPCPEDSESTNLESDDLEDHCVCLPCAPPECGFNKTVVIKKRRTGFPGNCCDLYECKPMEAKEKDCTVDDIIYADGDEWSTSYNQKCVCQNGLSLCSKKVEVEEVVAFSCLREGNLYKHGQSWILDDGCTNCTCLNGEEKCISHYCDFKERQIPENATVGSSGACFQENTMYDHQQTWTAADGCTVCTCLDGEEQCDSIKCVDKDACQSMAGCDKNCPNGFRTNRKGCRMCKCNPAKVSPEILSKYNITVDDLIKILEDYKHSKTTTTTSTTTTTTIAPSVALVPRVRHAESTTTEPSITPAKNEQGWLNYMVIGLALTSILILLLLVRWYCTSKRKNSMDVTPSRGSYRNVSPIPDNNNSIKEKYPM
ncbi:cysteine-rich motor neuron 1 protein-like isoform X2 [Cylas formicarius]|uniref:cysteine-rich motor neuron 1 protein-like isoform X2 n=1 Tax=Cylas formicarius TaxID=197179 RepID=UPI0029585EDF|nr:cysteine-rich motor neuron 1 protein-like isoform X2 [Cylas formicarius]